MRRFIKGFCAAFNLFLFLGSATAQAVPCVLNGTIKSVKSGDWSDPATWGGRVPGVMDTVNVLSGHTISIRQDTGVVAGIQVNCGGVIAADPARSVLIQSSKNFIVNGIFRMRPSSADVVHTLRFVNVNENAFVGGGMEPLDTDVGLWVMDEGQLDLQGSTKTGWLHAAGSIAAGATSISLEKAPVGWRAGDELAISPTLPPTPVSIDNLMLGYVTGAFNSKMMEFDERQVTAVSGSTLTVLSGVANAHPLVNNRWAAEVMNLTRNVRIEGTPGTQLAGGRTHVFIHSQKQQNVKFVQLRYVGPRKGAYMDRGDFRWGETVLGRYGLHFHHSMEGSRGSVLEGNVVRDVGSHAYVPHVSHGITLKDNIAYNAQDVAYWWDESESSHYSLWVGNIAAKVRNAPGQSSISAYVLGMGEGNIALRNVAVGVESADPHNQAAYTWIANNEGIWIFDDNLAHNSGGGINVWQNTSNPHDITRFDAYYTGIAIYHGAYGNVYRYQDLNLYGNLLGLDVHAAPGDGQQFHDIIVDGAGLADYNLSVSGSPGNAGTHPVQFRNVTSRGAKKAGILNNSLHDPDMGPTFSKNLDVILSDVQEPAFAFLPANAASIPAKYEPGFANIRVQPKSGPAFNLNRINGDEAAPQYNARKTAINAFAPRVWGKGTGMKTEVFKGASFNQLVATRREHTILYDDWANTPPSYQTGQEYSVRFSGFMMFQSTEKYRFYSAAGGGFRCTIDGVKLSWVRSENRTKTVETWTEAYPDNYISNDINAVEGKLVPFVCEYFNLDTRSHWVLRWESATTGLQVVPQSQIYPPTGFSIVPPGVTPEGPSNQPPMVNVGSDQTITLPTNSVRLSGTATDDVKVAKLTWLVKSAPQGAPKPVLSAASSSATDAGGLVQGTYIFALNAEDEAGAQGFDEVMVTVKPAQNQPPIVSAGIDRSITLPTDSITLVGAANDLDGSIASVEWVMVSGSTIKSISGQNTQTLNLQGMAPGIYLFRFSATDNLGAKAQDEAQVVVNLAMSTPKPSASPTPKPTASPTPRPGVSPSPAPSATPRPTVAPPSNCTKSVWNWIECQLQKRKIRRVYFE